MKDNSRRLEHFNTITDKEMQILKIVIHKYNYELESAEKVRSAYKVITNNGQFCLKRMKHGSSKVKNGCILTEELLLNKFTNTAKYFRTKDGAFFVKYKKYIFYLTEWLQGGECDLSNIDEVVNCTKLLARFHNTSNIINHKKIDIPNNLKNWPKMFSSNINELEKFKGIINGKRIKNEFDLAYLQHINNFHDRGICAIDILNKSQYYKISKFANDNMTICHNSFYYQNIIKKDNEYYIIDLDSIMVDLQITDLGKFIRRLMFKKSYAWKFEYAKSIIEAYSSINKLSKQDLEIMLALVIFPHKFWKLGRKRYLKQKNWSEQKYMHKLNRIISYSEVQEKFFNDYLAFLENYS